MKVYIAGKVTGEKIGDVFVKFAAASYQFQRKGHEVVNPLRITSQSWSWEKCMKVCINALTGCDAIFMLKDWKESKGAKFEHQTAEVCGIKIIYQK